MPVVSLAEPVTLRPQLQAATEEEALTLVNRWLHREVGMALNVERADFDPEAFCWHLPIHLAYGATGSLGIVGDVCLHAANGKLCGTPFAAELPRCAETLAAAHGITFAQAYPASCAATCLRF